MESERGPEGVLSREEPRDWGHVGKGLLGHVLALSLPFRLTFASLPDVEVPIRLRIAIGIPEGGEPYPSN